MWITDASGTKRNIRGLFAAMSEDDGKTWPYIRLITDDGPARTIECTDGAAITMSARNSEYRGYLSACQSLDGLIHVISSRNHYTFNKAWLRTPPPPPCDEPVRVQAAVETFDGPDDFDLADWHDYKGPSGRFNGKGQYTLVSGSHYNGFNRLVGKGSFEGVFVLKNIRYNPQGPRISEGVTLGFRDSMAVGAGTMFIWIKQHQLFSRVAKPIPLSEPPKSAKIKFIYNDTTGRWRIFYGLDGAEPTNELVAPDGREIRYANGSSESLAAYILMSNGSVDLDYFEIKPF